MDSRRRRGYGHDRLTVSALLLALMGLAGCSAKIGSSCTTSTDCSVQGNRSCDTSQVGGYCTVFGCAANSCPDNAICLMFQSNLPGCPYNDYDAPARTGRSLCMAHCSQNSDCRDGYICADPTDPMQGPWHAANLDNGRHQRVCIVPPSSATSSDASNADNEADAAICNPGASFNVSTSDASSSNDAEVQDVTGSDVLDAPASDVSSSNDAEVPDVTGSDVLDAPTSEGSSPDDAEAPDVADSGMADAMLLEDIATAGDAGIDASDAGSIDAGDAGSGD